MLSRGLRRLAKQGKFAGGSVLTQPNRTLVSEDHWIYRPTDGQPIPFSIFVTEDPWGEFDITRSIIMLPTWFGPTDNMKNIAQEIATMTNWRVFLPDIYGKGKCADSVEEAQTMFNELDYAQTIQDIGWIARKLRMWQPGSGLSTIGFSAGGAMALEAAASSDDISAAASFYGLPPRDNWEDLIWSLKSNGKPAHLQFGTNDTVFPFDEAEEFRQLLKRDSSPFQFFSYPGVGHNFMESEEYQSMMEQTVGCQSIQPLALLRVCKFLLLETPRLDLNALPEEFRWTDALHLSPNDADKASQWKSY